MPENTSEPTSLKFEISESVGRWSKGAVNRKNDVETVQNMLRTGAMILAQPSLVPNCIDGSINRNEAKSGTIKAIEAFQSRFMSAPDGVIGVGRRTWNELMSTLEGTDDDIEPTVEPVTDAGSPVATPQSNGQCFFPFDKLPASNWTENIRCFGARRNKGARAHAGCDLYFPEGTNPSGLSRQAK